MFKKILFRSRAGWFGDFSKNNISDTNERIIEKMRKKLAPLIEEYNKKH